MPPRTTDPWVVLVRAAKRGRGVLLTQEEVQHLVRTDDAIQAAAETCGTECVCDIMRGGRECPLCESKG